MTSGPIATYGLEQIALRDVPRLQRYGHEAVARFVGGLRSVSLLLSFLIGLGWVVYAIASQTNPVGFQIWHLLPPLTLGAIALTLINSEALKGLSRPVAGTLYGHLLPVCLFCILVSLFSKHLGSPGILTLYTGSYLVGALAARLAPGGDFRDRFFAWPGERQFRALLREGFAVCCVSLFGAFSFIIPLAIVELTRPAAEVSYITTAFRIAILFIVLSSAIHGVFAPSLSKNAELEEPFLPVFRVYGKAIITALITLGLPLGFGIAFPEMVMSIFGESFRPGAELLRLLLLVQLISLVLGPVPHLLLMTGHTTCLARLGIVKFASSTLLSFLLIPHFGGLGMVIAIGVSFAAEEIIGLGYAIIQLRLHAPSKEVDS